MRDMGRTSCYLYVAEGLLSEGMRYSRQGQVVAKNVRPFASAGHLARC